MERLQIGEVIYKLRKDKGITQDQLGTFLGVSTAAVSKWESGVSYPDITLLPILATFFNVTIDKLLNFKVELSEDEVKQIYAECVETFNKESDIEVATNKAKDYVLKYPNSYHLKSEIAQLLFCYSWKFENEEKRSDLVDYVINMYEDIVLNCDDIKIVEPSLFALGALYFNYQEYDKAIDSLNRIHKSECDPNDILASIYIQQNKVKEARKLLQNKLVKCITNISFICTSLGNSYAKEKQGYDMVERYRKMAIEYKKVLSPEADGALSLWIEYYQLAQIYLKQEKKEEAIDTLNIMVECLRNNPINSFKDINKIWCFNEVEFDKINPQINNLYENLFKMLEAKNFDKIRETEEFKKIIRKLKDLENHYKK